MLQSKLTRTERLRQHSEKFACNHEKTSLRLRTVSGGGLQRVYQCHRCGSPTSNALSKEKAIELCGGSEPPAFDNTLLERWESQKKNEFEEIFKSDNEEFWSSYSEYLESPEWEKKRKLVLERAGGICEGCRTRPAEHIHHISYEHVGNEFLFELVAVCVPCHERLHESDKENL